MTIRLIRSDHIYRKLLDVPLNSRREYVKENILEPFKLNRGFTTPPPTISSNYFAYRRNSSRSILDTRNEIDDYKTRFLAGVGFLCFYNLLSSTAVSQSAAAWTVVAKAPSLNGDSMLASFTIWRKLAVPPIWQI